MQKGYRREEREKTNREIYETSEKGEERVMTIEMEEGGRQLKGYGPKQSRMREEEENKDRENARRVRKLVKKARKE